MGLSFDVGRVFMKLPSQVDGFLERGGLWVVGQLVLFILVAVSPCFLSQTQRWSGSAHVSVGVALLMTGLVLLTAGFASLGSNLTPLPHPRNDATLRTHGIFAVVRHPIYGGLIGVIAGFCIAMPSMLELVLMPCAFLFFDLKATKEEQWLRERFVAYDEYAAGTRKLIPWIY